MQLGKLGLGPAKVLDGGVEGSVSHFASGCECDEVSEVAGYDFEWNIWSQVRQLKVYISTIFFVDGKMLWRLL